MKNWLTTALWPINYSCKAQARSVRNHLASTYRKQEMDALYKYAAVHSTHERLNQDCRNKFSQAWFSHLFCLFCRCASRFLVQGGQSIGACWVEWHKYLLKYLKLPEWRMNVLGLKKGLASSGRLQAWGLYLWDVTVVWHWFSGPTCLTQYSQSLFGIYGEVGSFFSRWLESG